MQVYLRTLLNAAVSSTLCSEVCDPYQPAMPSASPACIKATPLLLQAVHQQQAAAEQERRTPAGKAAKAVQEADTNKASETGRAAASYMPPKWAGVPEGWVSLLHWTLSPSRVTKPQMLGSCLRPCCSLACGHVSRWWEVRHSRTRQ